eukprot:6587418-Prymnesium_polylepis.1
MRDPQEDEAARARPVDSAARAADAAARRRQRTRRVDARRRRGAVARIAAGRAAGRAPAHAARSGGHAVRPAARAGAARPTAVAPSRGRAPQLARAQLPHALRRRAPTNRCTRARARPRWTAALLVPVPLSLLRGSSATHVADSRGRCVPGVGLYPLAALANHSCEPTAVQTFEGDQIVLRALTALPAGTPALSTRVHRDARAATRISCATPVALGVGAPRLLLSARARRKSCVRSHGLLAARRQQCDAMRHAAGGLPLLVRLPEMCALSPCRPPSPVHGGCVAAHRALLACKGAPPPPPKLEAAAANAAEALRGSRAAETAAIDAGEWAAALVHSRKSCELADRLYPASAPALGLAHLRLAKLCAHCGQLGDAVLGWRRALRILTTTHGGER